MKMISLLILLTTVLPYNTAKYLAEKRDMPLVIEIGATWCGPCVNLQKQLEKIYPNYVSVDIDDDLELAKKYMSGEKIPELVIFKKKNGKLVETFRRVGPISDDEIKKALK